MEPLKVVRSTDPQPAALHDRAMDNLRFIRNTMERAAAFTAVPGWGGVGMGLIALAAAAVAAQQETSAAWLAVWLGGAALSIAVAAATMARKARAAGMGVLTGPGRKFALSFVPPVAAGAILTFPIFWSGYTAVLPGLWLLCYGAGVVTGGAFSVRIVPAMGLCFMLAGVAALAVSPAYADLSMAIGFGVLHIVFGLVIARRHGG